MTSMSIYRNIEIEDVDLLKWIGSIQDYRDRWVSRPPRSPSPASISPA
jgi:hypothetical protein